MPTRDEMIRDLMSSSQSSLPAKGGMVASPSREQMIKDLMSDNRRDDSSSIATDLTESLNTTLRGGLETITAGASEPVISGINALTNQAYRSLAGSGDDQRNDFSWDNIKKSYTDDVEKRRADKSKYGVADFAGSIGGAFVPFGPGAKIAQGATEATTAGLSKIAAKTGAEKLGKYGFTNGVGQIIKGGAQGAASATASEAVRQKIEKATGFLKEGEAPNLMDVGLSGLEWGSGLAALPQAYKAAKFLGKRGISVALGPKVEVIDKYLANAERIRRAPTVEAIKDELDSVAIGLQQDVDRGRLSKDDAEKVLKAVQAEIRQTRAEASNEFSRQKFTAEDRARSAKRDYDARADAQKAALQGVRAPLDLSSDVQGAIIDLKNMVSKGSGEAYDILDKAKGAVNFHGQWKPLQAIRESLNIAGVGPATPQAAAAQQEIQRLIDFSGKLPSQISYSDAKHVIQQLDRAEKAVYSSGEFTSEVGQAFKALRAGLDQQLKEAIPEYAAKMQEVADNTALLKKMQDRFPDQRAIQARISGIYRPTSKIDYDDLGALASVTGKGFLRDVDEYVAAQQTLANPRKIETMNSQLPEFANWQTAENVKRQMQHPDSATKFIDSVVNQSGLPRAESAAQMGVTKAHESLSQAEARQAPFRTLNPQSTQSKIESLMRDRDPIETRRLIENVDNTFGTGLSQKIDDRRVLDSFEKGNTNGSRNVNLFTVAGHTVGMGSAGLAGAGMAAAGPVGALAGAISGAVVDKYGPQMAKGILDALLAIKGNPSIQKIQGLNLPPDVKNYITSQFVRHQGEAIRGNVKVGGDSPDARESAQYDPRERISDQVSQQRFLIGN